MEKTKKRRYQKPSMKSEKIFEKTALACQFFFGDWCEKNGLECSHS